MPPAKAARPLAAQQSAHEGMAHEGDVRSRILEAAARLFAEHGYEISMRQLAQQIGYTATTIYLYFEGKDALIDAVVDGAFQSFAKALAAAQQEHVEPKDQLRALGRAYIEFATTHPQHYQLMFVRRPQYLVEQIPGTKTCRVDAFDVLLATVSAGIKEPISSARTRQVADAIWSAVHGLALLHLAMPQGFDQQRMSEALITVEQMSLSLFR